MRAGACGGEDSLGMQEVFGWVVLFLAGLCACGRLIEAGSSRGVAAWFCCFRI